MSVVRCNEENKEKVKHTSEWYTSCDLFSLSLKENCPLPCSTEKYNFHQETKKVKIPEYISQEGIGKFFLESSDDVSDECVFEKGCTPSNSEFFSKKGCTPKKGAFFEKKGCTPEKGAFLFSEDAVLDSGATHTLSTIPSDFLEIASQPTVSLTAVDGKVANGACVGYIGTLRPNFFGLESAVYVPNLPIGRLLSTGQLLKAGWEVVLSMSAGGSHLKSRTTGKWCQLRRLVRDCRW